MLDHMILTVSDVERSLAFYQAALKPLSIKFFLPTRAYERRSKNRPQNAAGAALCGGVKVVHRGITVS